MSDDAEDHPSMPTAGSPAQPAAQITQALPVDRPWTGNGPSVEEVGGRSILVRLDEDLTLAKWIDGCWISFDALGPCELPRQKKPTGWIQIPKIKENR